MSRTLYLTPRSPFARKIRVLMIEKNLMFESIEVDLAARTESFEARSPLGHVPVLVDGDAVVFDSTIIAEYLDDRYPAPSMIGSTWAERLLHRSFDQLGDTIADETVALFLKRGDVTHSNARFDRALAELERRTAARQVPAEFGLGHAAVASAFAYAAIRLGPERTARATGTHAWLETFAQRESLQATKPPPA